MKYKALLIIPPNAVADEAAQDILFSIPTSPPTGRMFEWDELEFVGLWNTVDDNPTAWTAGRNMLGSWLVVDRATNSRFAIQWVDAPTEHLSQKTTVMMTRQKVALSQGVRELFERKRDRLVIKGHANGVLQRPWGTELSGVDIERYIHLSSFEATHSIVRERTNLLFSMSLPDAVPYVLVGTHNMEIV